MRSSICTALFLLVVAPLAWGQDITAPREVTIKKGRLATVVVNVTEDKTEYVVLGEALDGFREYEVAGARRLKIRVIGYEVGTGYIVVGTSPMQTIIVRVVESPGPKPPDPPPAPVDPPVDSFVVALKQAITADGMSKQDVKTLALGYDACAVVADTAAEKTVGRLIELTTTALRNTYGKQTPPTVRKTIGGELNRLDAILPPGQPEAVITTEQAKLAKLLFEKVASALKEAAK